MRPSVSIITTGHPPEASQRRHQPSRRRRTGEARRRRWTQPRICPRSGPCELSGRSGARRPLFHRDRLSLVATRRVGTGGAPNPQGAKGGQASLVSHPAGTPAAGGIQVSCRTPTAPHSPRRDPNPLRRGCCSAPLLCLILPPVSCFCPWSARTRHMMGSDEDRPANLCRAVNLAVPRRRLRPDLIHRPGDGTSPQAAGSLGVTTRSVQNRTL
jgi:hypothetical protein